MRKTGTEDRGRAKVSIASIKPDLDKEIADGFDRLGKGLDRCQALLKTDTPEASGTSPKAVGGYDIVSDPHTNIKPQMRRSM